MISPCTFRAVATGAIPTPDDYEGSLRTYAFERAEEGRAVRVGEKERSEAAAVVAKYAHLFTREQLDVLRAAEDAAPEDAERERFYRLRKSCERGLLARDLVHMQDEVQNELLAIRIDFRGESMPLRNADAKLSVLDEYAEREELGEIHADATATMNEKRLEVGRAAEVVRTELTGIEDPVLRSEDEKGISLRQLAEVAADGSALVEDRYFELRDRWLDRLLGSDRPATPSSYHAAYVRRLSPLSRHVSEGARDRGVPRHAERPRLRPGRRLEHPHRPRGSPSEVAAGVRDRLRSAQRRPPHHEGAGWASRLPELPPRGGHALHYAGCDPELPYAFRALARDNALTEIYAFLIESLSREPGWHEHHFDLSPKQAAENAEATIFLHAYLFRRYTAKLQYELDFWSRFPEDGGTSEGYADRLTRRQATSTARTGSSRTWTPASTRPTTYARGSARPRCART